jgi:hypothetical protein
MSVFTTCTCGRQFATKDGFEAHKISLHDAEPDPVQNKINDDKIRAELDAARSFSAAERKKAASSGAAMADGSYPINSQADANNAWKLRNNGKASPEAVVAHIRKRVKALGLKMPGESS